MDTLADLEARERRLLDLYEECVWAVPWRVPLIERALAVVQEELWRLWRLQIRQEVKEAGVQSRLPLFL